MTSVDLEAQGTLATKRSRAGCFGCREAKVKCSEVHPICKRCSGRSLRCEWPAQTRRDTGKHRNPREVTSCDHCRTKKVRCGGREVPGGSCRRCAGRNLDCIWQRRQSRESPTAARPQDNIPESSQSDTPTSLGSGNRHALPEASLHPPLVPHNKAGNIKELIALYFATVHNFGYLSFIHEVDFWELYDQGQVSDELCMVMAANALRFGDQTNGHDGSRNLADDWVQQVNAKLYPRIMTVFGAIDLMTVLLSQHYEFLCGRYTTGFLLSGLSLKMTILLRLHDSNVSSLQPTQPLLGTESLRRLAWAVYVFDATISGGAHGQASFSADMLTIQLPSDERVFLQRISTVTEPLAPMISPSSLPQHTDMSSTLGIGAHMIRAMAARQLVADLHSRIQRLLISKEDLPPALLDVEDQAARLLGSLPSHLEYSKSQYHIYKEQRPMILVLHVSRINTRRHLLLLRSAASMYLAGHEAPVLPSLVQEARNLSRLFGDAIDLGVALDPQLAMHAYHGIEILLFQPPRTIGSSQEISIEINEMNILLRPLITAIRRSAAMSDLVSLLYPEAVNRMIRKGYVMELTNDDIVAVLRKMHSISNADAEFNFEESFWRYELSLARLHGANNPVLPLISPVIAPQHWSGAADAGSSAGETGMRPTDPGDNQAGTISVSAGQAEDRSERNTLSIDHGNSAPRIDLPAFTQSRFPPGPIPQQSAECHAGEGSYSYAGFELEPLARLQNMFDGVRSRATSPLRHVSALTLDTEDTGSGRGAQDLTSGIWCDDATGFDANMALFEEDLIPYMWSTWPGS